MNVLFVPVWFIIHIITLSEKRNNSVVQLSDGTFSEVMNLVAFTSDDGTSSTATNFCILVRDYQDWRKSL